MSSFVECPKCARPVDRFALTCPSCGAEVALLVEDRRLASEYLRYLAVAAGGGGLLSAAITIPLGVLARHSSHMSLMWLAAAAAALALWLAADRFEPAPARAAEVGERRRRR